MLKVFLVGLPKSGTSTIHKSLVASGFKPGHWEVKGEYIGPKIYENFAAGLDPVHGLTGLDAITQPDYINMKSTYWPQMDPALLLSIEKHHPDCLFLLNVRNVQKVISSITRWPTMRDRLNESGAPGLLPGMAADDAFMEQWIVNHYEFCRRFFAGKKFLEVNIEDPEAPQKIGAALGVEMKWWGQANVNPT